MINNAQNSTRMTGVDQVGWNVLNDQDWYCIWGIASLEEPLRDDLVKKALEYLIQTIPILNSKPVTNWLYGYWQFIEKENVEDLILRTKTETDEKAKEELNKVFLNPIKAKEFSMIRIISIDGPLKHYFVIQVHHLAVDGEGLKRICVRFAEIYQELYRDKEWKPTGILDPCRSWWQIARNFNIRHLWLILKACIINIYGMITSILQKKMNYTLIGDSKVNEKAESQSPRYFESITIEQEAMLKLKAFTKSRHFTINDILMASLSLATMKWNNDRGDDREWLKFGYTVNLRRWWGEPNGTFGNFSAVLIHDEIKANLQNPSIALAATKSKLDKLKKWIGLDYFVIPMQVKLLPYFLVSRFFLSLKNKLFEFLKHAHAMTNIGIVFEEAGDFGHTKAIGYSFLAPAFPGGFILYTITTYRNVTTIYLGCSEDYLKKESAKSFLLLWKERMLKIIG
ncbi:MAG: hypothetical protein EHM85_19855 [Desulfobacteraceae bacterium]|nr:MAG: hypothetical protein EHM85_19855 [Desulfobacteraceae bacterium]